MKIGGPTGVEIAPGASVAVQGLGKRFSTRGRDVVALDGVNVTASAGEFVSIIGPSGCGKSTLFNVVAGLMQPDGGRILLDGRDVTGRTGEIAYMPQKDLLFPWRTVLDNAIIGLQLGGVPKPEARRRAEPLFERFGLAGFARAYPDELSGGMRQRVAFLRTVIQGRGVMLLDEPFGALDSLTRSDMQQWLLGVWEEVRTTVVFVTHDVAEAVFLSDRVYVMAPRPGRVCAVVDIDLPRPRHHDLPETDAFTALERRLRRELRLGTEAAESQEAAREGAAA